MEMLVIIAAFAINFATSLTGILGALLGALMSRPAPAIGIAAGGGLVEAFGVAAISGGTHPASVIAAPLAGAVCAAVGYGVRRLLRRTMRGAPD